MIEVKASEQGGKNGNKKEKEKGDEIKRECRYIKGKIFIY